LVVAISVVPPFAQLFRRYRRERGITQEVLAEQAGLSARGIRAVEQGESSPHKDTVRLLAEALRLSPDQRVTFEQAAFMAVSDAPQGRITPPIA
jgi:transcriptional regulator with XRE-family HTH domain